MSHWYSVTTKKGALICKGETAYAKTAAGLYTVGDVAKHVALLNRGEVAADLLEALEEAEWGANTDVEDGGYEPACPVCDGAQTIGHIPDCTLAAAIAKARP